MARESCNLDKEEAEILKPSSSPPSSSSPSPAHKEEAEILKPSLPPSTHQSSSSSSSQPQPSLLFMNSSSLQEFSAARKREKPKETAEEERKQSVRLGNRCSSCRRKVGLTGFRCRCGHLFCGQHRYSDTHDCSFDYKAFGGEQISKANPVIRAAKIIKI